MNDAELFDARSINAAIAESAYGRARGRSVYCVPAEAPQSVQRVARARTRHGVLQVQTVHSSRWTRVLRVWLG
jgi:hypothetical protein